MVDPLTDLEIDVQSFDIPRLVTVYPDKAGMRWWTTNKYKILLFCISVDYNYIYGGE